MEPHPTPNTATNTGNPAEGGPSQEEAAPALPGPADESGAGQQHSPEALEAHSPLREASTTVAGAIDSVLAASDTRHRQISETLSYLRQRQQEAEDRLSHMEQEQHQVAQTASAILSNQKTGVRCYDEVTSSLAAIRKDQQAHAQQLDQLGTQLQQLERQTQSSLKQAVLIGSGTLVLAGIAALAAILLLLG